MTRFLRKSVESKRKGIKPRSIILLILLLILGFIWGVGYVRDYWFPYSLIRQIKVRLKGDPVLFSSLTASGGVSVKKSVSFNDIATLPYVGNAERKDRNPSGSPVKVLDEAKSFPGMNLFTISYSDEAILVDHDGDVVHCWDLPREEMGWDSPRLERQGVRGWRTVFVTPELELIAVFDYSGIVKLDAYSNIIWLKRNGAHHSFFVADDGAIYVLTHRFETIPEIHPDTPLISDLISVLSPSGMVEADYSIIEIIRNSGYGYLLPSVAHMKTEQVIDILHTNSIEVMDGSYEEVSPNLFKRGNVLLSTRNISTVFIIDLEEQAVRWAWGPSNVAYQHSARVTPGPSILLFDNGIAQTTVLEIDPLTYKIGWAFTGEKNMKLSSRVYGACQRLPNDNILITDSRQSRALEVTREGEIVWTYELPRLNKKQLPVLYEMRRYANDYFK